MGMVLKYTGLRVGTHTVIYDGRDASPEFGFCGSALRIDVNDEVPIEAYQKADWCGDVRARHLEMGLAIETEATPPIEDAATADAATTAVEAPEKKKRTRRADLEPPAATETTEE